MGMCFQTVEEKSQSSGIGKAEGINGSIRNKGEKGFNKRGDVGRKRG